MVARSGPPSIDIRHRLVPPNAPCLYRIRRAPAPPTVQPDEETPMQKRAAAVTFKGNQMTLVGPQLKPGDKAPDFKCANSAASTVGLADTPGKARMFSVVPSLDTPVCST